MKKSTRQNVAMKADCPTKNNQEPRRYEPQDGRDEFREEGRRIRKRESGLDNTGTTLALEPPNGGKTGANRYDTGRLAFSLVFCQPCARVWKALLFPHSIIRAFSFPSFLSLGFLLELYAGQVESRIITELSID